MVSNTPRPVVLFEVVKGILTGQQPNVAETHVFSGHEMQARSADPAASSPKRP